MTEPSEKVIYPDIQKDVAEFLVEHEKIMAAFQAKNISEGKALLQGKSNTLYPAILDKLAKINAFHISLFAYFIDKLKATKDGDGSLLDHTMYMYGSGMGNSSIHSHSNLPIVLVGGGAGKLKGGRHIKYAEPTPLAYLHLTLLDKLGIHLDKFGDSKGRVDALLSV